MLIAQIREIGGSRKGTLYATYDDICNALDEPNVTDLDDPNKVKASWGFRDDDTGAKAFIWCYKVRSPESCGEWSIDGNMNLLIDLFGKEKVRTCQW